MSSGSTPEGTNGLVAQLEERRLDTPEVVGSRPTGTMQTSAHGVVAQSGERRRGTPKVRGSRPLDSIDGDVAQLGERCLRTAEARGSTPLISMGPRRRSFAQKSPIRRVLGAVEGTLGDAPRAGESPASARTGL